MVLLVQGVLVGDELPSGEEAGRVVDALPQLGEVIVLKNVKLLSGGLSRSLDVMCIPRANVGGCGLHGKGGDTLYRPCAIWKNSTPCASSAGEQAAGVAGIKNPPRGRLVV